MGLTFADESQQSVFGETAPVEVGCYGTMLIARVFIFRAI